jgi:hypothetical protein
MEVKLELRTNVNTIQPVEIKFVTRASGCTKLHKIIN